MLIINSQTYFDYYDYCSLEFFCSIKEKDFKSDIISTFNLIISYTIQKKFKRVIKLYEKIKPPIEGNPKYVDIKYVDWQRLYYSVAYSFYKSKKDAATIETLNKLGSIFGIELNSFSNLLLSKAHYSLGEMEVASKYIKKAHSQDPFNISIIKEFNRYNYCVNFTSQKNLTKFGLSSESTSERNITTHDSGMKHSTENSAEKIFSPIFINQNALKTYEPSESSKIDIGMRNENYKIKPSASRDREPFLADFRFDDNEEFYIKLILLMYNYHSLAMEMDLNALVQTYPFVLKNVYASRIFAVFLTDIRSFSMAEEKFVQSLEANPTCLALLRRFPDILFTKQASSSELTYRRLYEGYSDLLEESVDVKYMLAACLISEEKYLEALKVLTGIIESKRKKSKALQMRGHLCLRLGESKRAEVDFRESSKLNPFNYNAWLGMATVARVQDKSVEAYEYSKKALSICPFSFRVVTVFAGVCNKQERFEEAEKALKEFLRVKKEIHEPYSLGVVYYFLSQLTMKMKRYDEALGWCRKAKKSRLNDINFYFVYGKVLMLCGEKNKGYRTLMKALSLSKKDNKLNKRILYWLNVHGTEDFNMSI